MSHTTVNAFPVRADEVCAGAVGIIATSDATATRASSGRSLVRCVTLRPVSGADRKIKDFRPELHRASSYFKGCLYLSGTGMMGSWGGPSCSTPDDRPMVRKETPLWVIALIAHASA